MVQQGIYVRDCNRKEIIRYCEKYDIMWTDNIYTESMNTEGVVGTPEEVQKVVKYADYVERKYREYRSNKGVWWRIWN